MTTNETKTKNNLKTQEQGRSMIEMLGVLAIIGALSVGGLAALRVAQNKLRANVIANDVMLAAADVLPRLEILFQKANAASTTEELTPTFKPKNDTMEIWRCGTDGAEIIFNDVKKEVCENLMKITQIKGIVSFGTAPNNAAACPDVPNNVELFGRCTDLNQMVFSVGQATELCGGRMCTSDEYCSYDTTATSCSSGVGKCIANGGLPNNKVTLSNGTVYIGPKMNWWSAGSYCKSLGMKRLEISALGCAYNPVEHDIDWVCCTTSTEEDKVRTVGSTCDAKRKSLGESGYTSYPNSSAAEFLKFRAISSCNYGWLNNGSNSSSCNAYRACFNDGVVGRYNKNNSDENYALCQ